MVMAFEETVWSVRASVAVHETPLFVHVLVRYEAELAVGIVSKVSLAQPVELGGVVVPVPEVDPEPQIWFT